MSQVSNDFIHEGLLRQIGSVPRVRVWVCDVDVTTYLTEDGKPHITWNIEEYPSVARFQAESISFTLDNTTGDFSPHVASNFFTDNGEEHHGYRAPVRVDVGYQLDDGTDEWVYGFVGRVLDLDTSQDRKRVQVTAIDLSILMQGQKAHNIGYSSVGNIWTGSGRDWAASGTEVLPISKGSFTATKDLADLIPASSLRIYGDLDYRRAVIDYDAGSLELETDPPTGDAVIASYKYAYRDIEYHGIVQKLLQLVGIIPTAWVERVELPHPEGAKWFTPRGRFGIAWIENPLTLCRALVYGADLDELYAGCHEKVMLFDYSEGYWVELGSLNTAYVILKMAMDDDFLWIVASATKSGTSSHLFRMNRISGGVTDLSINDGHYGYPNGWGGMFLQPLADTRRSFQIEGDSLYYRFMSGGSIGCKRIHRSTLVVSTVFSRSEAAYSGITASYDFVVTDTDIYHLLSYDDGTPGVAQTLEMVRTNHDGSGATSLYTETWGAAPYPNAISDLCYSTPYDRVYFTAQMEQAGDDSAEWCYVDAAGTTRITVDTFTYTENAARGTIEFNGDVYYIAGSMYEGGPVDEEDRGHLFLNEGGLVSQDQGLIWNHTDLGAATGTCAPLCINTHDDVLLMVACRAIDFAGVVWPFIDDTANARSYWNGHLVQFGERLASVVPVYNGNDQDIWSELTGLARASFGEIGFDTQGRFFFRSRPQGAPATLAANISDVATSLILDDATEFVEESSGDTGWIALVTSGTVELARYTTKTGDTLWGMTRGLFGTAAVGHSAGDGVYPLPFLLLNAARHRTLGELDSHIPDFEMVFNRIVATYADVTEVVDGDSEGDASSETQFGQRQLHVSPRFWDATHYPQAQAVAKRLWARYSPLKRRLRVSGKWVPFAEIGNYTVVHSPEEDIHHLLTRVERVELDTSQWQTVLELREV